MRATDDQGQAETRERSSRLDGRLLGVDWTYELLYLLGVLAAIALALSLAGRRPGWSIGQTPPDPALVQLYAAHFRHGDFFPVWSSSDAYGMGSPLPLFYEKAFFMLGGLVFIILGGALKATMIVTIAIFMVIGAYGMRRVLGVVTDSRMLRSVGSVGFLLTNWAFAEWLVRAELAEFAAFMIVPWLLYCCLILIRDRRVSWLIIPTMVVLTLAHNVVAEISVFMIAVTGVAFLVVYRLSGLRAIAWRLIIAGCVIGLILAPLVIAQIKMAKYYDPPAVIIYENQLTTIPTFMVGHLWQYLFNPSYHWLSNTNHQIVPFQLDLAISILLIVGAITLLVLWLRKAILHNESELPRVNRSVVVVLVVSLLVYMFFQLGIATSLYPGYWQLDVIGYPFRMMTFAVPLALILAMVVADWYLRVFRARLPRQTSWAAGVVAALWLASFVLLSPIAAHEPAPVKGAFPYEPFLPVQALTLPSHETFRTDEAAPLFAEYLPTVVRPFKGALPTDVFLYEHLHSEHVEAQSLTSVPCSVVQTSGTALESLRITYRVVCKGSTKLALPISYNPFTGIEERVSGRTRPLVTFHVRSDPRIVVRITGPRTRTLIVDFPTLGGILF